MKRIRKSTTVDLRGLVLFYCSDEVHQESGNKERFLVWAEQIAC